MRARLAPLAALTIAAAAVVTCFTSGEAVAEPFGVGGEAVTVQAEKLEVDVMAGEAVLTGKVVLSKGDLTVSCPRIDLRFSHAPAVSWVKGSGGVSADVRGVHAEAPTVELDMAKQILELRGGVKLSRGQGWLTADTARIEIATGKVSLTQVKGSIPVPPRGP